MTMMSHSEWNFAPSVVSNLSINATPYFPRPRLLVSVRSASEAEQAILGGADILDVKEPSLGSLGMASLEEISRISNVVLQQSIPLSVALGELLDWTQTPMIPSLPKGITFAKIGLSGIATQSNWRSELNRVRAEFVRRSGSEIHWVAVAYADNRKANSPQLAEIVEYAINSECQGVLIDTWTKGEATLHDFVDLHSIMSAAKECHAAGLFLAIAGRLGVDSLTSLVEIPVDILAIRSAACVKSDRISVLEASRVARFRLEMISRWNPTATYPERPV